MHYPFQYLGLFFGLLLLCGPSYAQTIWYVDAAAPGPGSGTLADPYVSVTYGLAQAATVSGDTLIVLPGLYANEAVDYLGKDVVVQGQGGAMVTILEANSALDNPVVRFANGETGSAALMGVTLRGGTGDPTMGVLRGGGLYCSGASPSIQDVVISGNSAVLGGGAYFFNSNAVLMGCSITSNVSPSQGGGIFAMDSNLNLNGCEITNHPNSGVYARGGSLQMHMCEVSGNFGPGVGAGCFLEGTKTQLLDCRFDSNQSMERGSGVFSVIGNLEVDQCTFTGNGVPVASGGGSGNGSGIYISTGSLTVEDSLFAQNTGSFGGAIYIESGVNTVIRGTEFTQNTGAWGGAITAFESIQILDCSFVENLAQGGLAVGGALASLNGAIVERSVFIRNEAIGIGAALGGAVAGPAFLQQCTLVDNGVETSDPTFGDGGGAYNCELTSCIAWGNTIDAGVPQQLAGSQALATFSLVEGSWPGMGNIDGDPNFWNSALGDYHLLPGSPAIDAGDPNSPLDPDMTRADMGALPFDSAYCGPGCDGDIGSTYCAVNPNSTGQPANIYGIGSQSVSSNLVLLSADNLPIGQMGFFVLGSETDFVPLFSGRQGNLCMGTLLIRLNDQILIPNSQGVVARQLDLTNVPQSPAIIPGSTWHFQYWYRDQNPNSTSNMTQGLTVQWL